MSTWGIDGTVFLSIYAGAASAIAGAALLVDRRAGSAADAADLDEYEIAYLSGGARLAAVVALVNLDRRGAIDLGDGLLRDLCDSGDLDLDTVRDADHLAELGVELHVTLATDAVAGAAVAHPVEAAALQAARGTKPRTPWRVVEAAAGTRALDDVRDRLERRGLRYASAEVDRLQARWRWLLPVLAVGGWRVLAEVGADRPVGALLMAMLVTLVAMLVLARRRRVNTRAGDRLVADLGEDRPEALAGAVADRSPGLALALAGVGALWASDPALALAVASPSAAEVAASSEGWFGSARSWWGSHSAGHGGWWGGGGCGAGGDGAGGCGGGGGGCGGGGGGCGGGG